MPKVSVIMPVYNTQRYLRECLDSVVNQTLRNIEIICVDDSSTDGSPEILREYQAKDERITILKQEKSNAGAARNLGLSIASGEYLSFLDSDDFFELTMLEHMYACAKNRNADIVVCEMKVYHEDSGEAVPVNWHIRKELLPEKTVFAFSDIKSNAFRCITAYVWDKLIKWDIVIEKQLQFQSLSVLNDTVFVNTAMMSAKTITVLIWYTSM
jgi:cellulose synthase/poly-beta-1,6-N-acetylglucosamine synthase-like glycosyltransferase